MTTTRPIRAAAFIGTLCATLLAAVPAQAVDFGPAFDVQKSTTEQKVGAFRLGGTVALLHEPGLAAPDRFGAKLQSRTAIVGLKGSVDLNEHWTLSLYKAKTRGGFEGLTPLNSISSHAGLDAAAASLRVEHRGLFATRDNLSLGVSRPLRLHQFDAFDPAGLRRQTDYDASYSMKLDGQFSFQASIVYQHNLIAPTVSGDGVAAMLRFAKRF